MHGDKYERVIKYIYSGDQITLPWCIIKCREDLNNDNGVYLNSPKPTQRNKQYQVYYYSTSAITRLW